MGTSSSTSFNPTITTIITQMYRAIGVVAEDEAPTAGMYEDALFKLNALVKKWMATGIHVWTEEEGILFLQPNQVRYVIGGSGDVAETSDANTWTLLTLASSSALGASTITVEDDEGVTDGLNIGVVLDDGTMQWTTVDGTPALNVITLDEVLTGSASAENYAVSYSTNIVRPLKVPNARRLAFNGLLETPMVEMSRKEYMDLPNKYSPGTPTQFFYAPKLGYGELYIWPAPNNVASNTTSAIRFTWYRPLEDFLTPSNTSDFPQEWVSPIMWNLAFEMADDFDVPEVRYRRIEAKAREALEIVQGWDRESQPIFFGVEYDQTAWR